ncbi:MAG: sugar phosphate isomerase/epimerase family protein [Planctomycetota bacterium]
MHDPISRRTALKVSAGTLAALAVGCSSTPKAANARKRHYEISLAQWSLHRELYAGTIDNLDFPTITRDRYGIEAVEFVNAFFKDKANDAAYLAQLKGRADDAGVKCLLIMCDGEGNLGDPDNGARAQAVSNHIKWLDAANALGCHSIRVNAASQGTFEEQQRLAADGLRRLAELGEERNLNVLVENHGGLSSHGAWLAGVMKLADHPRVGTLPDFGNFCMDWSRQDEPDAWYDRYKGVTELMPYAKAVSAKSYDFNDAGEDTATDYTRMMTIVTDAGYNGYVGIEYEGGNISEHEGVLATKRLLERVRETLTT